MRVVVVVVVAGLAAEAPAKAAAHRRVRLEPDQSHVRGDQQRGLEKQNIGASALAAETGYQNTNARIPNTISCSVKSVLVKKQ